MSSCEVSKVEAGWGLETIDVMMQILSRQLPPTLRLQGPAGTRSNLTCEETNLTRHREPSTVTFVQNWISELEVERPALPLAPGG